MPAPLSIKHAIVSSLVLAPLTLSAIFSFAVEPEVQRKPKDVERYSIPPRTSLPVKEQNKATPSPQTAPQRLPSQLNPAQTRTSGVSAQQAKAQARKKKSKKRSTRSQKALRREAARQVMREARQVWSILVPAPAPRQQLTNPSAGYSLTLDPHRYPEFPDQHGGIILVDWEKTLPPLVKSLIQEKNPQLRIVTENPAQRRRFYRSLLNAGGFYSLKEDSLIEFGTGAKLVVHADFEIEKSDDALHQDIVLLNVAGRRPAPKALVRFLAQNGFTLTESAPPRDLAPRRRGNVLYQVSDSEPARIAGALLQALSVPYQTGKRIYLYDGDDIGVRLDVPVDGYFRYDGKPYVVAVDRGDAESATLAQLLETKYRVIMLNKGDDLAAVTAKMFSRMGIRAGYDEQELWPLRETGYGVRVPGVMLRDSRNGKRKVFVTDRKLDPLVQELVQRNGYRVSER